MHHQQPNEAEADTNYDDDDGGDDGYDDDYNADEVHGGEGDGDGGI